LDRHPVFAGHDTLAHPVGHRGRRRGCGRVRVAAQAQHHRRHRRGRAAVPDDGKAATAGSPADTVMTDINWHTVLIVLGLAVVTVVTRAFFLFSNRSWTLPRWAQRGLQYAPIAALAAVVVPE